MSETVQVGRTVAESQSERSEIVLPADSNAIGSLFGGRLMQYIDLVGAMAASRHALPDAAREDYLSAYQGDRMAESMRYVRSYPAELPKLAPLLPGIATPVEIIAGAADVDVPLANATFLHQRLPRSKLDILDARHFTWEDAAAEYAAVVTGWWRADHLIPTAHPGPDAAPEE